ncbi:MAG: AI-2E family transporter [Chloroflexi bacterium]|nr:AI-2E family transporter [Chloroflexota bacterium]
MGFELNPQERRWLDAALVLGTIALGFVVLGFVTVAFTFFGDLIMVFFLAWLLAFLLYPLVKWVSRAIPFMTRTGAVFTVYFLLFGGLILVVLIGAAALVTSIADFVADVPRLRAELPQLLAVWQQRIDELDFIKVDLVAQATVFLDNISTYASQLVEPLQQVAVASLGAIGNLLLVIVLSLYMVADRDRLAAFMFWLVPTQWKAEAELLEEAVSRSFGGFIRGQILTGIAYGGVAFLASLVFGLDFLAATTVAAGVLMAIPFFGPFVAWLPPVLVAFLFKPDATLWTLVVMAVGWVLVMNFLTPRIMADALRIHPIVVLGSVFVGLKVGGIAGAVFGIPIAAVLSALFLHTLSRRRETGPVAARAARRVGEREGREVRLPREPDPTVDSDVEVEAGASAPDAGAGEPESPPRPRDAEAS